MEEKKKEDRNEVVPNEADGNEAAADRAADGETVVEAAEEPEVEERRGLFGAKKRERNEKAITVLYAVAGVYLLYTAYMTARELIEGRVEPGRDTVISIAFTVIFAVAAVWILISSWRLHTLLKAKEKEEAEKLAAEMAERGETPEEPAKGGLLGGILAQPQQSSVASRAAVYYNPADDEEEEADPEDKEETAGEEPEEVKEASDSESDDKADSEE